METKTCPFCKSDIPNDASHCKFCGKDVRKSSMASSALFQAGCLLLSVSACIGVAVLVFSSGLMGH
jgi:hypothetical protein